MYISKEKLSKVQLMPMQFKKGGQLVNKFKPTPTYFGDGGRMIVKAQKGSEILPVETREWIRTEFLPMLQNNYYTKSGVFGLFGGLEYDVDDKLLDFYYQKPEYFKTQQGYQLPYEQALNEVTKEVLQYYGDSDKGRSPIAKIFDFNFTTPIFGLGTTYSDRYVKGKKFISGHTRPGYNSDRWIEDPNLQNKINTSLIKNNTTSNKSKSDNVGKKSNAYNYANKITFKRAGGVIIFGKKGFKYDSNNAQKYKNKGYTYLGTSTDSENTKNNFDLVKTNDKIIQVRHEGAGNDVKKERKGYVYTVYEYSQIKDSINSIPDDTPLMNADGHIITLANLRNSKNSTTQKSTTQNTNNTSSISTPSASTNISSTGTSPESYRTVTVVTTNPYIGSNNIYGLSYNQAIDAINEYNKGKEGTLGYLNIGNPNGTVTQEMYDAWGNQDFQNWYSEYSKRGKTSPSNASQKPVDYAARNNSRLIRNYGNYEWQRTNADLLNQALASDYNENKWVINSQGQKKDIIQAISDMYGDTYKGRRFEKRLAQGKIKSKDLRRLGKQEAAYNRLKNSKTLLTPGDNVSSKRNGGILLPKFFIGGPVIYEDLRTNTFSPELDQAIDKKYIKYAQDALNYWTKFRTSKGQALTKTQIAGILGNIHLESGFNPNASNGQFSGHYQIGNNWKNYKKLGNYKSDHDLVAEWLNSDGVKTRMNNNSYGQHSGASYFKSNHSTPEESAYAFGFGFENPIIVAGKDNKGKPIYKKLADGRYDIQGLAQRKKYARMWFNYLNSK